MKSALFTSALVAIASTAVAAVTGQAEGFAAGVTGGGNAAPVYPNSIKELISYLGDSQPRNIYINKEFNFIGSEGKASGTGCAPWGTGAACQTAINQNGWCDNYQKSAPKVQVSYDKAGVSGINVGSNKSLIGVGNKGVIRGKGLRLVNGVNNIIIQNVHITEINPQYVWGGDAITLNKVDRVWIDHVTTSLIGRQHIVLGTDADNRVTISNCKIDGNTKWSATCDGHHYWGMYFTGSSDMITFQGNYIVATSGRAPKVQGNTLLHAVNNYWYDNTGHAFELSNGGQILAEGNVFQNIKNPVEASGGQIFAPTSSSSACAASLGRNCEANALGSSGALKGADTSFLGNFKGKNIAKAQSAQNAKQAANFAGFGTI